ncbi:MAG: carboxypeptidase-like regulatory domain-containing protein, partial [Thermoanaerobaculales bacterium]|nr:carboxypeptidase-like regulatory domain-containing protein [Thermoanaerobaculales bacterium]
MTRITRRSSYGRWSQRLMATMLIVLLQAIPRPLSAEEPRVDKEVLLTRIHRLSEEIQARTEQARINAGRLGIDIVDLARDAEHFDRDLEEIGRILAEGNAESENPVADKVETLRLLVHNLSLAARTDDPAILGHYPERKHPQRETSTAIGIKVVTKSSDDCTTATLIDLGTYTGSTVGATNDGEAECGSSIDSPDVWFRFSPSSNTRVAVETTGSSFDTVLSVHSACPGTIDNQIACNDDWDGLQSRVVFTANGGTDYLIRLSGFDGATGDFVLSIQEYIAPTSSISGLVTDAATGDPIDIEIGIWFGSGYLYATVDTGADGRFFYWIDSSRAYFVSTRSWSRSYVDELYNDIECFGGPPACDPTSGDPIIVAPEEARDDINFALRRSGVISGMIRDPQTGEGIEGIRINAYDATGKYIAGDYSDALGEYAVVGLLEPCYIATVSSTHEDKLYDDLPCPGGPGTGCDATAGSLVPSGVEIVTEGIDFFLNRLGILSGTVTDAVTGDPVGGVDISVFDSDGDVVKTARSAYGEGAWTTGGLVDGLYQAAAGRYYYVDQLYDGLDCPLSGCVPESGTPIPVTVNTEITGIDFALTPEGRIGGTLRDVGTGDPLVDQRVYIYRQDGTRATYPMTDDLGVFISGGLDAGTYYLATATWEYVDEVYDDLPCDGWCEPLFGTPVTVSNNTDPLGIDFDLVRK